MKKKKENELTVKEIADTLDKTFASYKLIDRYIKPLLRYVNIIIDKDGYLTMFGDSDKAYRDTNNRFYRVLNNDLDYLKIKEYANEEHVSFNPFFDNDQMLFICLVYKTFLADLYMDETTSVKRNDVVDTFNSSENEEFGEEFTAFLNDISDDELDSLDLDLSLDPSKEDEIISLSYYQDDVTKLHHYSFIKFPKTEREEILCEGVSSDRKQAMFILITTAYLMHNFNNGNRSLKDVTTTNVEIRAMKIFALVNKIRSKKIDKQEDEDEQNYTESNFSQIDEIENNENVVDISDDNNESYTNNAEIEEEDTGGRKEKSLMDLYKEANSDFNDENEFADF